MTRGRLLAQHTMRRLPGTRYSNNHCHHLRLLSSSSSSWNENFSGFQNNSIKGNLLWFAGSALTVLVSSTAWQPLNSACEAEKKSRGGADKEESSSAGSSSSGVQEYGQDEELATKAAAIDDDDMKWGNKSDVPIYEGVPDEDVETDCFVCRTHRQGPCRTRWRNFEYCAKDHPDDGSEICAVYVKSFQDCWMQHLNLYLLVAMTINHERIEQIEKNLSKPNQRRPGLRYDIKWDDWNVLFDQEEDFLGDLMQIKAVFDRFPKSTPIWKVYETLREDPFVVNVECRVPTRRKDGRTLKVVYALDQEDRAVGLTDYDKKYEIEKAESQGKEPDLETHRLILSLVPGVTEAIQIKAVYAHDDTEDDSDDEEEEEEGLATEELDIVKSRRTRRSQGSVLVSSDWIPLPGIELEPDSILVN